MKSARDLQQLLERIDHRGYPAYKDTAGAWQFDKYALFIDHVQGDPFAAPSSLHVEVAGNVAGIPAASIDTPEKKTAMEDYLLRCFYEQAGKFSFQAKGSGKSGVIAVMRPGQEMERRSALEIDAASGKVLARFEVGFPANGRTINARELIKILFQFLPQCVERACFYKNINTKAAQAAVKLAADQAALRAQMKEQGLLAFVADGAVLPRASGVSDKPMKGAVSFESPETLRVTLKKSDGADITGMGIRRGITLLVGGGYHGKSTLLKAMERGVYSHIAGDGREYVLTDADAVKIRAEDGRSIWHTDISLFIGHLPNGKSTECFDSEDASGSTSQAANVGVFNRRGHERDQLHDSRRADAARHRAGQGADHALHRAREGAVGGLRHFHGVSRGKLRLVHRRGGHDHPDGQLPAVRYYRPRKGAGKGLSGGRTGAARTASLVCAQAA